MKQQLLEHYQAIKAHGLIHPGTKVDSFIDNLDLQYTELCHSYADDVRDGKSPSSEFIQECTGLLLTITDLFQHYNIDLKQEILDNIKLQPINDKAF